MALSAPAAFGGLLGITSQGSNLYDVSTSDGSLSLIGNTGVPSFGGLAYNNGTLYGITQEDLYTIDPTTALPTLIAPLGGIGYYFEGALAFDASGTLWMAGYPYYGSVSAIYTVDTGTGAVTFVTNVAGKVDVNGIAFRSDGTLVGIDRATDTLFSIDLTTFAVTDIATFGLGGIGSTSGLAAMGDIGYMATGYQLGTNSLYEVDLLTGSTSLIGSFGFTTSGIGMAGLANTSAPVPEPVEVEIDIKPGSDPNSINCNNEKGVIAVAILTTDDFDATTVDHTTVTFEGASETHVDKKTDEPRRHEEDVDGDGDTDLVFHFRKGDTNLTCDSTEGTLIGETFDGQAIEGSDAVRMID